MTNSSKVGTPKQQTIYLAGTMSLNGWRHLLVQDYSDKPISADEFPVMKGAIFGRFNYSGPYPVKVKTDDHKMPDTFEHDDRSWKLRRSAIDKADIVFGWIELKEMHATIAELAYAAGKGKLVRYALSAEIGHLGPNGNRRLFPEVLRTFRMFDCGIDLCLSPRMAFAQLFNLPKEIICNVPQQNAVYFIEDNLKRIKIGFSKNLKKRSGAFQTGSSIPHEVIGSIPGGKHLESKLHSDFALLRLEREWFHATQGLRSFIEMELGLRHSQVGVNDLELDSYGNSSVPVNYVAKRL